MPYELSWRDDAGNGELCFSWKVQAGGQERVAVGLPAAHGLLHAVVDRADPLASQHTSYNPMAPVMKPAKLSLDPAFLPLLILEPLPSTWQRQARLRAQRWVEHPAYLVALDPAGATFWDGPQLPPPRTGDAEAALGERVDGLRVLPFAQRLQVRLAVGLASRALRQLRPSSSDVERVEIIHQFVHRLNALADPNERTPEGLQALHALIDALALALGLPLPPGARQPVPTRLTHWGDWARTF